MPHKRPASMGLACGGDGFQLSTRQRHAEIAGAGIAGLSAAAALAQRGWSVHVREKGSELREIRAGIFLPENGLRALEAIGAYDDVAAQAELIEEGSLRDHYNRDVPFDASGAVVLGA